MHQPKKPINLQIDTPNVDVEFDRNAEGERKLKIKAEPIPLIQKIKTIGKILRGKLK